MAAADKSPLFQNYKMLPSSTCVSAQQHREAHNRLPSVAAQWDRGAERAFHLHATIQQYQMSDVPIPKFLQTEFTIAAMHIPKFLQTEVTIAAMH